MLMQSYLRHEPDGWKWVVVTRFGHLLDLAGAFSHGAGSICHEKTECAVKNPDDGNQRGQYYPL